MMSVTTGTFPGVRIVDMPDLGPVTDTSSLVAEHAGSGRFTAPAIRAYSLGKIDISGAPGISKPFAGYAMNCGISFDYTAASATLPETCALFQMTSGLGADAGTYGLDAFKMAVTAVCTVGPGSASGWAYNGVVNLQAGAGAVFGVGLEIDINVNNQQYTGVVAPYATNIYLTGTQTGSNYAQAAMIISYGNGAAPLWNYGIVGADYTTAHAFNTAFISDQSKSPIVLHSNSAHTTGIDFSTATFTGGSVLVGPNTADISMLSSTGVPRLLIGLNNADHMQIGASGLSRIDVNQSLIPGADNIYVLGMTGFRWATVWATNGAIQTSDPELKTDIAPLPEALPIVAAVNPVTFRWKDGGGGKKGRRTHWGFLAPEVKSATDAAGVDFGGYVLGEDGTHNLRPDQLIPILWQGLRELTEQVVALRAQIGDVSASA